MPSDGECSGLRGVKAHGLALRFEKAENHITGGKRSVPPPHRSTSTVGVNQREGVIAAVRDEKRRLGKIVFRQRSPA